MDLSREPEIDPFSYMQIIYKKTLEPGILSRGRSHCGLSGLRCEMLVEMLVYKELRYDNSNCACYEYARRSDVHCAKIET